MSYIVQGYCFISVFLFITKDSNERNKISLLLPSVAMSYIFRLLYNKTIIALLRQFVYVNESSEWYYIGLVAFSIILAYLLGIFSLSKMFARFLEKSKIPHTVNSNFWADMFQEGIWFNVYLKGHKYNYIGQVSYIEENQCNPHVLLINYSMYDIDIGKKIQLGTIKKFLCFT